MTTKKNKNTPESRRASRSLVRMCGPYDVKSLSNGELVIHPAYTYMQEIGHDHPWGEHKRCRTCDGIHISGILNRMNLADRIAEILNNY